MRAHLPLLLALSASSPLWRGRATGLASDRYVLLVFAGIWALFHGVGDMIKAFQIRKLRDV
jgi:Glutamate-cysteine ligase family 2(GCS2)